MVIRDHVQRDHPALANVSLLDRFSVIITTGIITGRCLWGFMGKGWAITLKISASAVVTKHYQCSTLTSAQHMFIAKLFFDCHTKLFDQLRK